MLRLKFLCRRCHVAERTWSSSRVFGGHYLLNQKYTYFKLYVKDLTFLCNFIVEWFIVSLVLVFCLSSTWNSLSLLESALLDTATWRKARTKLVFVCQLFGLNVAELELALTTSNIITRGETIQRSTTLQESQSTRDAMAKARKSLQIYDRKII